MINTSEYKTRLQTDLAVITADLQEIGIHNPEVPEDWIPVPADTGINEADENISADRAEDLEEKTATLGALEARYNNIVRALTKIEAGTFGICEISGEEIEADRLDANPAARTCKAHMNDEATLPL